MNINPFDLLKNAQNIQGQLNQAMEELKDVTATGTAGGNIVKVTMNGQFETISVEIDPIAVDPRDVPMLQDLIVAASHDATQKIREVLKQKAGPLLGGMNIPGMGL